jgi:hypothetical protein
MQALWFFNLQAGCSEGIEQGMVTPSLLIQVKEMKNEDMGLQKNLDLYCLGQHIAFLLAA